MKIIKPSHSWSSLKVLSNDGYTYWNVNMHVVHVDEGDGPDKDDIASAHQ